MNLLLKNCFLLFVALAMFSAKSFADEPTTKPDDGKEEVKKKEIKILSWNIFMLPGPFIKTNQKERAHHIAEEMLKNDADIIVFQEAFHKRGRKIIHNKLKELYPHNSGKLKKKNPLKYTNSGIFIVSKHPLEKLKTRFYSRCKTSDCLASKAGVLVEADVEGDKIQIVGTHLQAWDEEDKQIIRESQYKEIKDKLLEPFKRSGIAQFIVGDFNTERKERRRYKKMLEDLEAEDGDLCNDEEATCGSKNNYFWKNNDSETPKILDYILFRKNDSKVEVKDRFVKIFKSDWKKNGSEIDLSDHYAVEAIITIK
jgi:endonuclease/exonuclease/phosphatase family metal-dependent hydrolase